MIFMLKPFLATLLGASIAWTNTALAHHTHPALQPTMSAQDLETDLLENDRDGTVFFVFFGLTLLALALIDRNTGGLRRLLDRSAGSREATSV